MINIKKDNLLLAKKYPYQEKRILLVNTGPISKRFILQKLKKMGLDVTVLNKEINWANNYVNRWILADTSNHEESIKAVDSFLNQNKDFKFDGILTFWENDVLLSSKLCDKYRMIGVPYNVAKKARNKFLFRQFCNENNLPVPKFKLINDYKDLKYIEKNFNFPVVIKPIYGAASLFVIKADDLEELKNTYNYVKGCVSTNADSIFSDGIELMVEEYIDGDEVDIDIILQNGRIKFFSITDNSKTNEPFFIETGQFIPSSLPFKYQDRLIKMADEVLEKMGIQNGCIHFEAKSTKNGPVPIEVNLRMGGDEVYSFVKGAWKFDLIEHAVKIALGIYIPTIDKPEQPFKYLAGKYFLSDYSGILVQFNTDSKLQKKKYIEEINFFKKIGDSIFVPPEGYEYLGWITVSGDNPIDAEDNLEEAYKLVKYEVAKFDQDSSVGKIARQKKFSLSCLNKNVLFQRKKIEKIKKISIKNQRNLHVGIAYNDGLFLLGKENEFVGRTVEGILLDLGYKVSLIDFNNITKAINEIQKSDIDIILNLCKSNSGTPLLEGNIAGVFDIIQVPYTGSNSATLSLCVDKIKTKKLLEFHGIPTPKWDYIYDIEDEIKSDLTFPLIIKPSNTDNSFGITNDSVVTNKGQLKKQLEKVLNSTGGPILIEEFIEGDEYDISILGSGDNDGTIVLPPCRSIFDKLPQGYWHIYPFEAKYNQDEAYEQNIRVQIPPKNISKKLYNLISEIALDTYNIFDCQDYGTVEIRVDKKGNPFVLEINPNPQLDFDCFFALSAKKSGYNYSQLLEEIIHLTIQRYKNKSIFYNL